MVGRSEGEYSRAEDQESIWSDETSEASEEDRSREVVACAEAASEGGNDDMGGEEVNRELNRVQHMNYLISEGQFEQAHPLDTNLVPALSRADPPPSIGTGSGARRDSQ